MSHDPVPVTHVGLTVSDIHTATKWYIDAFNCRHIIGPLHIKHGGSHIGEVFKGIFGKRSKRAMSSSRHRQRRRHRAVRVRRSCVGACGRQFPVLEDGRVSLLPGGSRYRGARCSDREHGRQAAIEDLHAVRGRTIQGVSCQDPWVKLIKIYSHSSELMYANRDRSQGLLQSSPWAKFVPRKFGGDRPDDYNCLIRSLLAHV
ncbi:MULTISPECIES: lactoylglutathione lyase [unclassified Bradyrhizobium]|uniref:lactoylglutathione lyase n=1 Tax=unclassified Bradyrhizobium TaxID=2631580 RepID=UPI0024E0DA9C|nr:MULTISPECIES: lactoylglutathione lyase [unclassified Bradyrhizobium]